MVPDKFSSIFHKIIVSQSPHLIIYPIDNKTIDNKKKQFYKNQDIMLLLLQEDNFFNSIKDLLNLEKIDNFVKNKDYREQVYTTIAKKYIFVSELSMDNKCDICTTMLEYYNKQGVVETIGKNIDPEIDIDIYCAIQKKYGEVPYEISQIEEEAKAKKIYLAELTQYLNI